MKRPSKSERWTPLVPGVITSDIDEDTAKQIGEVFVNSIYTVFRRNIQLADGKECIYLSIKRNDKQIIKDWRHFQRIKNQLAGDEWEGVELYPAESRLVDSSNQYHLWCSNERLVFGFNKRFVIDDPKKLGVFNAVQRPGAE